MTEKKHEGLQVPDEEAPKEKDSKDSYEFTFLPGRQHEYQTSEAILRVRARHGKDVFGCDIPLHRIEDA